MVVQERQPDALQRLWWGVRRHRRLVIVVVLAVVVIVAGFGSLLAPAPAYEASALIVPRTLTLDPLRLSRFQQAVFANGGVVDATLADPAVPYTDREEFLEHVRLEPVEDNIALGVVTRDPAPDVAAAVSNATASQLVAALNDVGPSAGVFVVHTAATAPDEPVPALGPVALVAIALVAAVACAFGAVGLVVVLRRPVLSVGEVAATTGVSPLGELRLPAPGGPIDPVRVLGLSALIGTLFPTRTEACVFVSPSNRDAVHNDVAGVVARGLARGCDVIYVLAEDRNEPADGLHGHPRLRVVAPVDLRTSLAADRPVVIEGPGRLDADLPQLLPADVAVVLVVREGTPAATVQATAEQFLPGELRGVLYVQTTSEALAPAGASPSLVRTSVASMSAAAATGHERTVDGPVRRG